MGGDDSANSSAMSGYKSLKAFLAQHAAFFEAQGYRAKKTLLRLEFTRLSDGGTVKIPWPFDQITRETTPETFLAGFRSMLSGGKDD